MAPPGPVKIGHKKDGRQRRLHRFHVSRPPPLTRPLDPLLKAELSSTFTSWSILADGKLLVVSKKIVDINHFSVGKCLLDTKCLASMKILQI